jgi:hypothetical protein
MKDIGTLINEISTDKDYSQEDKRDVQLWLKGRALASLVNTDGWDVVKEMLQSYARSALEGLIEIHPAEKDKVSAAHAIAFAVNDLILKLFQDIGTAVENSRTTPQSLKEKAKKSNSEVALVV